MQAEFSFGLYLYIVLPKEELSGKLNENTVQVQTGALK